MTEEQQPAGGTKPTLGNEPPPPVFASLEEWVCEYLSPMYRRRVRHGSGLRWCPEWYRHQEAIERLQAMWDRWEETVVQRNWSDWFLYVLDPHMAVLMSPDGPFSACGGEHQGDLDPLPVAEPNPGMWRGTKFADPVAG